MRAEHGFRILDYKVDNESSSPRVCFNFSEQLARKTDFSPYVAVSGVVQHRDLERGPADLRRGTEARRALCDRAAPGPAVGGRRIPVEVGRLRDLCARPLAAGAFRRPGLCAAAPGPAGRAARHRQHVEGLDRRLSRRRPQSARHGQPRRLPEADRFVAGRRDRIAGRGEDVERVDGRRLRAQPGRRHRLSGARGGRQARTRRLSHYRAAVEGLGQSRGRGLRRDGAARDAMDGRLRPRPDRDLRRRRRARARAIAGLRRARLRRGAQARRAQQRSAGGQDDRRRRAGRFRSGPRRAARAARRRAFWSRRSATTTVSSASPRTPSTSPTAASRGATRRARSTRSSTPSAASTAPARPCSRPPCFATRRAWPRPGCR